MGSTGTGNRSRTGVMVMDTGDKIALGAMIIALIAMVVAVWQATEARKARKAAVTQAKTADETLTEVKKQSAAAENSATSAMLSLGAAERAAGAAEEQAVHARHAVDAAKAQVAIMQKQLNADTAARDEQDGPQFTLTAGRRENGIHPVTVTMVAGPEIVIVHALWIGDSSDPEAEGDTTGGIQADDTGPHRMVQGSSFTLGVRVPQPDKAVTVDVRFHCTEDEGSGREWTRSQSVTLKPRDKVVVFSR